MPCLRLLPLYSFESAQRGPSLQLASKKPEGAFKDFALKEARFRILERASRPSRPGSCSSASRTSTSGIISTTTGGVNGRSSLRQPGEAAAAATADRGQEYKEVESERRIEHDYLGLKLKNPLVISACPLSATWSGCGAGGSRRGGGRIASLFEEQIEHDSEEMVRFTSSTRNSFAESADLLPRSGGLRSGPDGIPSKPSPRRRRRSAFRHRQPQRGEQGRLVPYAKMMQDAGADALEFETLLRGRRRRDDQRRRRVPLSRSGGRGQAIDLHSWRSSGGRISAPWPTMGVRLSEAGADGLVLSTVLPADIDLESMETCPSSVELALRTVGSRCGGSHPARRVKASLAATGGIHDATGS